MKAIISIFSLSAFITCCIWGQERIPVELKKTQFSISILEPSLLFEIGINDRQSVHLSAGLAPTVGEDVNGDFLAAMNPLARASFRHYYPRKRVKKELFANSGNYIAVTGGYLFDTVLGDDENVETSQANSYFFGPVWGIQRNYKSGIHLGLGLGYGFGDGKDMNFQGVGIGYFNLGFTIQ